jgi:hypothetical protein
MTLEPAVEPDAVIVATDDELTHCVGTVLPLRACAPFRAESGRDAGGQGRAERENDTFMGCP